MKHIERTLPPPIGDGMEIQACWNEIGVHGDGSCRELQKFILCRNCPVYSSAVVRLLDRPEQARALCLSEDAARFGWERVAPMLDAVMDDVRGEGGDG